MGYRFEIDQTRNLIRETWTGPVGLNDYETAIAQLARHPDYREGMDSITDYRDAEIKLSYDAMRTLASRSAATEKWGRVAIVVSRNVEYGLARMYEEMIEFHNGHIKEFRIFNSIEEAERWLA